MEGTGKHFQSGLVRLILALVIVASKRHLLYMLQWPNPFLGSIWSLSLLITLICGCPSCKAFPTSFLILSSSFLYFMHWKMCFFLLPPSGLPLLPWSWGSGARGKECRFEFWQTWGRNLEVSLSIFVTSERVCLSSHIFHSFICKNEITSTYLIDRCQVSIRPEECTYSIVLPAIYMPRKWWL